MLVPRTVAGLNESTGWNPASPRGVRQFGEVMLDELALSGFSLLGESPKAVRSPDACSAAAEELSALGIDRAHADPQPLRVQTTRTPTHCRPGLRAADIRARPGAAGELGGRRARGPGEGRGPSVPASGRSEAVAGLGARRRSGRRGGPAADANRTHPSSVGFQRRDARAARSWLLDDGNGRPTRTWIRSATSRA